MSTIIQAASIFSASDPTRPCAVVRRVGGEQYVATDLDGSPVAKDRYDTFEDAQTAAEAFAAALDGTDAGKLLAQALLVQSQADQIADLKAQVADLTSQVAATPVAPGKLSATAETVN